MERKFFREPEQTKKYNALEKVKVCVAGLGEGVGTTFIASNIAYYLSENHKSSAFVEIGDPRSKKALLYDSVAMEQRFKNRNFVDFYKAIRDGEKIRGRCNIEEGINWAIITPEDCEEKICLKEEEKWKLINNVSGEYVIVDIGSEVLSMEELFEFDIIVAVLEPMPSKMLGAAKSFQQIKKMELRNLPIIWVVNKYNEGVIKKEVVNYLKAKGIEYINMMSPNPFFRDEYNCKFHFKNKELWQGCIGNIENISKKIENITKHSH